MRNSSPQPILFIESQPPPKKTIVAEVIGRSNTPLRCPNAAAKTYVVDGNLKNLSNGKEIQGVEFVNCTGCQFAVVIPAFVADQIGLDEKSVIGSFDVNAADGGSLDAPTYKILLAISDIRFKQMWRFPGWMEQRHG